MADAHDSSQTGGELNSAIAEAVVRIQNRHTGHGPAKAQAFFRHNVVVVVFEDAITKGERRMIEGGRMSTVRRLRRASQEEMRSDLVDAVEHLTGCGVVAFMSDNHADPDIGVELFVLDRWVHGQLNQV